MAEVYNRVRVSTTTTGTGTVMLGSATSNAFCTFAEAGVADAATIYYLIEDGNDFEIGTGVYTASGTTMTRATVILSKIGGTAGTSKINLSGSAVVMISAAADFLNNKLRDAATNSITEGIPVFSHLTSGTADVGFGTSYVYKLQDASGGLPQAAQQRFWWLDPTAGNEDSLYALHLMQAGVMTLAFSVDNFGTALAAAGYQVATGGGVSTTFSDGHNYSLRAWDVDGATWTNFVTVTAGNTPTCVLPNRITSSVGQVAHFWVYWTANSTTILASHNVSSIDDDNVGDAGVNLTISFSSDNYAAFVTTNDSSGGWDATFTQSSGINVHTAGVVDVLCNHMQDGTTAAAALVDPEQWQVVGFGVSA